MRPPCISYSNSCQGFSPWFLLVDCESSGRITNKVLQWVAEIQSQKSSTSLSTQNNPDHLAFRSLGIGYGWAIQDSQRWHDTFAGGSGQGHQVDRCKADQEVRWTDCGQVHSRHCNQIWIATQHH